MHQNTKPFACIACASDSLPKPLDSDLQDEHSLLAGPEQLDRLGAGFRPGRVATDLRVLGEDHGAECERDRERGRVAGDAGFVSRRIFKDSAAILILPGGNFWTQGELPEVSQAVHAVIDENRPAAAICRRPWHSRTAACSTTAAHQQRARVHGSVCEKLSRGGVLPAFF